MDIRSYVVFLVGIVVSGDKLYDRIMILFCLDACCNGFLLSIRLCCIAQDICSVRLLVIIKEDLNR